MDEGFPGGRRDAESWGARPAAQSAHILHAPEPFWRALSAVDPPRSISNRVVKRGSADGTGGMPAGSVGPCAS